MTVNHVSPIKNGVRVNLKCLKCSHEWETRWGSVLAGSACPECAKEVARKKNTKWTIEAIEDFLRKNRKDMDLLKIIKYAANDSILQLKCCNCSCIWEPRFLDIYYHKGCSTGKFEKSVIEMTKESIRSIFHITPKGEYQKRFDGLRGKRGIYLRFDWSCCINGITVCVEAQGYQHYN
jgi:hypothetical protein